MVLAAIIASLIFVTTATIISDFQSQEHETPDEGYLISNVESAASEVNINNPEEIQKFEELVGKIPEYSTQVETQMQEECFDVQMIKPDSEITLSCVDAGTGLFADFNSFPQNPGIDEDVVFDASISDPSEEIETYNWDFDDGTEIETEDESITHSYSDEGNYQVELEISDGENTHQISKTVTVEETEINQVVFTETESHTWEVPSDVTEVEVLVVGGGGGGGMQEDFSTAGAGGGGAGGVVYAEEYSVSPNENIDVEVGEGGEGADEGDSYGESGEDSSFDSLTAVGGGGGAGGSPSDDGWNGYDQAVRGEDGGSGGGSRTEEEEVPGGEEIQTGENTETNIEEYGNPGGEGLGGSGNDQGGSGGGGAGSAGLSNPDPNGATGGDGGIGIDFSGEFGDNIGQNGYFAGGGGGGAGEGTADPGSGGLGGGGSGTNEADDAAESGQSNTGGGGGGGSSTSDAIGGDGGSGIVIIQYED